LERGPLLGLEPDRQLLAVADEAVTAPLEADLVLLEPMTEPRLADLAPPFELVEETATSSRASSSISGANRATIAPRRMPPNPGAGSTGRSPAPSDTRRVGAIGRE